MADILRVSFDLYYAPGDRRDFKYLFKVRFEKKQNCEHI